MAANIKLFFVIFNMLVVTLIMAPIQVVLLLVSDKHSRKLPLIWHKIALFLVGVKVHVHGKPSKARPLMFVANHISWSDIMILGSVCELCFIAKDEVKSWPGINYLAKLQRTVFVNRQRRTDTKNQITQISKRLVDGDAMVLFAEGTTGNGNKLLPFKSALFGAAQNSLADDRVSQIIIQPVAIAYNTMHGMPLGRYHQAKAAWPGEIKLAPHLLNFLKQGAYDVDVAFGGDYVFDNNTKRKEIANEVYVETHEMFSNMRRLYHR